MKNSTKLFFAAAATLLALESCNKMPSSGDLSFSDDEIRFGNAGIAVETKAFAEVDNDILQANGFNAATVFDSDGGVMFNKAVAYSSGAYSVPGEKYYWPASGTMSFYGVYPKTQTINVTSGVATLSYSHDTDTDLIAAKATAVSKTSSAVMMDFDHILSQVSIKAQGAETTVDYKVFSVTITDANGGTYAYADGTWTPNSTTSDYSVYSNGSGMAVSTSAMTALGPAMSYVPGTVKLNVIWKCYNHGTSTVVCEKDVTVDVTLPQGKHTTLNLTLPFDSSDLTFNSSVGAWQSDSQNIEMEEPYVPELVSGVFTVNDSGKKVKFVKGNLYWNGSSFRCEENQYDYPTVQDASHIGFFFWSRTATVAYASSYSDETAAVTDTFFAADGGATEGYTVLSNDEWDYLIENALAKPSDDNYYIEINNVKCAVLMPDNYAGTIQSSYTAEEWATAETTYGLVALPIAGFRNNLGFRQAGNKSYYWSSTPYADYSGYAWYAYFEPDIAYTYNEYRDVGYSIRLVSVSRSE